MNIRRTKKYYQELKIEDLCQCNYCRNYYQEVEKEYPALGQYLDTLGVDIRKPFETMPLEVDDNGIIEYMTVQYVVFGSSLDFKESKINDITIDIARFHPSTNILEEHFLIDVSPIVLKWEIEDNSKD